jgi:hypothetical protein
LGHLLRILFGVSFVVYDIPLAFLQSTNASSEVRIFSPNASAKEAPVIASAHRAGAVPRV